jgi:hypothetical protein
MKGEPMARDWRVAPPGKALWSTLWSILMPGGDRSPDHNEPGLAPGALTVAPGTPKPRISKEDEDAHNGTPKPLIPPISKEDEDATVVYLLQKRLKRLPERHGEDVHKSFADVEFKERLRQYGNWAKGWRAAQVGIWLAVASLGLLGSVLAAVESGQIIAVVAGALVATLTTFAQAARPGLQADGYTAAKRAMRDEAWDLLNGTGDRYESKPDEEPKTDEEAFKAFAEQIRQIVKVKRSTTQLQLPV